jgi:hypothetical protein
MILPNLLCYIDLRRGVAPSTKRSSPRLRAMLRADDGDAIVVVVVDEKEVIRLNIGD